MFVLFNCCLVQGAGTLFSLYMDENENENWTGSQREIQTVTSREAARASL